MLLEEKRSEIGKYASEIRVVAAARHFSHELSKPPNKSTRYGAIFTIIMRKVQRL